MGPKRSRAVIAPPQPRPLLRRQTVTNQVTGYIAKGIAEGQYVGGQQIRQEAIATELGVSRIPVREALLQLEAMGLVVNRPHRGAIVADLSIDDAIELFETRLLLEPFLLAKAMGRLTTPAIAHTERVLKEYAAAVDRSAGPSELSRLNWEYHAALMAPAQSPRLTAFIQTLYNSADRYLRIQIQSQAAQARALAEHRKLFELYKAGNVKSASKLLKSHIADASAEIVARLKRVMPGDRHRQ
jgi:DNA-binding GntR family transcriptional regulator